MTSLIILIFKVQDRRIGDLFRVNYFESFLELCHNYLTLAERGSP